MIFPSNPPGFFPSICPGKCQGNFAEVVRESYEQKNPLDISKANLQITSN